MRAKHEELWEADLPFYVTNRSKKVFKVVERRTDTEGRKRCLRGYDIGIGPMHTKDLRDDSGYWVMVTEPEAMLKILDNIARESNSQLILIEARVRKMLDIWR